MTMHRREKDSMGAIDVPADKLWGAQTQRSLEHFRISTEKMPVSLIQALALTKRAAAKVNQDLGLLDAEKATAIINAADEVLAGKHPDEFPLAIWQTGSGTQSNMNMNEVLANRASELLGGVRGMERKIHPNDDVNKSQSSNDVFPTAMHVAAVIAIREQLIPQLNVLKSTLNEKAQAFRDIVKIGRTHLQDATPLTLGQEFSGYVSMLDHSKAQILKALDSCRELAIGGTAVGTGLNAPEGYDVLVAAEISRATDLKFVSDPNKFHGLTSHDAVVFLEGALKGLAADLMKIANDIRWLASGPRCGLGELNIPANEPGSSIMPGKVNPTQCEAVTMVAVQVMGNDAAIGFAASQGNFELNVFKPVIAYNLLQSIRLLADVEVSFAEHCVDGITANKEKIDYFLNRSLMNVTALSPLIGYENAAKVAHYAHENDLSLRDAALALKVCTPEEFDATVVPANMVHPLKKAK